MGMPEQKPQVGMNIAPDGTVYEVLKDGTIKRIGKVSSDGNFEPFGEQKNDFKVIDSVLYRIINGREEEIGRISPDGDIEPVSATWVCPKCGMKENNNEFCPKCGFKRPERVSKTKRTYKTAILVLVLVLLAVGLLWNLYLTALVNQKASSGVSLLNSRNEEILQRLDELEAWQKQEYFRGRKIDNLIWSDRSLNKMNWETAKKYCENLSEGNFTDWRLPTISELKTTIQNCNSGGSSCKVSDSCLSSSCYSSDCYCSGKSNNGAYYSKLGDPDWVWLWSSSTLSDYPGYAWRVGFNEGRVGDGSKSSNNYVRCVRKESPLRPHFAQRSEHILRTPVVRGGR